MPLSLEIDASRIPLLCGFCNGQCTRPQEHVSFLLLSEIRRLNALLGELGSRFAPKPLPLLPPKVSSPQTVYILFDNVRQFTTAETRPTGPDGWVPLQEATDAFVYCFNGTDQSLTLRGKYNGRPQDIGDDNILDTAPTVAAGATGSIRLGGKFYPFLSATVQFATAPASGVVYVAISRRLKSA